MGGEVAVGAVEPLGNTRQQNGHHAHLGITLLKGRKGEREGERLPRGGSPEEGGADGTGGESGWRTAVPGCAMEATGVGAAYSVRRGEREKRERGEGKVRERERGVWVFNPVPSSWGSSKRSNVEILKY